jgi:hypothetical protein
MREDIKTVNVTDCIPFVFLLDKYCRRFTMSLLLNQKDSEMKQKLALLLLLGGLRGNAVAGKGGVF